MFAQPIIRAIARCAPIAAFCFALCLASRATAAVKAIGSVNPVPPTVGGIFVTPWIVGDDQAADADLRAWATIDAGTALQYGSLIVGDEQGFVGVVNLLGDFLNGINTKLTFSSAGSSSNPTVQVGGDGTGYLNVRGGTTMTLSNAQGNMSIGQEETGVGYVTVADPFTMLTVDEDLFVGKKGIGRLEVLSGGLVRTLDTSTSHAIHIGSDATGVGTAIVDGPGSVLRAGSSLVVGGAGIGTLTISNHAIVDVDNIANAAITVGQLGRLILSGGTLIGPTPTAAGAYGTTVFGMLGGSGLVRGTVNLADVSSVEAGPGDLLQFNGAVLNQGALTVDRGEVQFLESVFNNSQIAATNAPGRITLKDGTVRFPSDAITPNAGVIASTRGTNDIHGRIINTGTIVVASETVAVFHDSVSSGGGTVQVLPRGNALFLSDLTFTSSAALSLGVTIDDLTTNASAQLGVGGAASLAGNLAVTVDGNPTPSIGQVFDLITADGGISGTFGAVTVPDIPGILEYRVIYNPSSIQLAVRVEGSSSAVPGDYNGDFVVDAADYSRWRDSLGQTGANLAADGNRNGIVDQADYDLWRTSFGQGAGSGSGIPAPSVNQSGVPEPASLALVGLLFMLLPSRGMARRRPRLAQL